MRIAWFCLAITELAVLFFLYRMLRPNSSRTKYRIVGVETRDTDTGRTTNSESHSECSFTGAVEKVICPKNSAAWAIQWEPFSFVCTLSDQ